MYRYPLVFCVGIMIFWSIGCGPPARKAAPLAKVGGKVLLDGKEFDGEITFDLGGEPPRQIKIEGGKFEGEAHVGKNKIKISKVTMTGKPLDTDTEKKPTPVEHVDAKFNDASTIEAEVPADGKKDFEWKVTSRAK